MSRKTIAFPSPGDILLEEFLKPLSVSQYRLAKELHVSPMTISEIVNGKRTITASTALRLGKFFSTSAEFWINLQTHFDIQKEKVKWEKVSKTIKPLKKVA